MAFNKEKEFEAIEEMLNEVRIACNRAQIPFIWVAAVKDSEAGTEYKTAIDENDTVDTDTVKYHCNALVPGSMGIKLKDDKIKELVKILNGFKAVAKDTVMTLNPEEFSYSAMFPQKEIDAMYRFDHSEGAIMMPEVTEKSTQETAGEEIVINDFQSQGVLPRIDDDFKTPDEDPR